MVTIDRSDGVVLVWLKHLPPVQGMGDKTEEHIRGRILAADDTLVRLELTEHGRGAAVAIPWSNVALVEFFPKG